MLLVSHADSAIGRWEVVHLSLAMFHTSIVDSGEIWGSDFPYGKFRFFGLDDPAAVMSTKHTSIAGGILPYDAQTCIVRDPCLDSRGINQDFDMARPYHLEFL